jgi:hypothetical protein
VVLHAATDASCSINLLPRIASIHGSASSGAHVRHDLIVGHVRVPVLGVHGGAAALNHLAEARAAYLELAAHAAELVLQ